MARAIWSGAISFGLVNIPIKLYNAVSRKSVHFNQLDARDSIDLLMALGEALFFEDDYGAAATVFESGIDGSVTHGRETGEAMLEW